MRSRLSHQGGRWQATAATTATAATAATATQATSIATQSPSTAAEPGKKNTYLRHHAICASSPGLGWAEGRNSRSGNHAAYGQARVQVGKRSGFEILALSRIESAAAAWATARRGISSECRHVVVGVRIWGFCRLRSPTLNLDPLVQARECRTPHMLPATCLLLPVPALHIQQATYLTLAMHAIHPC